MRLPALIIGIGLLGTGALTFAAGSGSTSVSVNVNVTPTPHHHRHHRHHRHHKHVVVSTIYHVSPVYRTVEDYHRHWFPEHHVVATGKTAATAHPAAHHTTPAAKPKPH